VNEKGEKRKKNSRDIQDKDEENSIEIIPSREQKKKHENLINCYIVSLSFTEFH
jgi:hypothetical protein